jgi:3-oxoacyl-[acyl-carrier-protein] synthase-3
MSPVGIVGAAVHLPDGRSDWEQLCREEGIPPAPENAARVGVREVPCCRGEKGSEMALSASRTALERAGLAPDDLDVIVDYSILPQEYLVPAWNMSNRIQHELGAKKAFTIGFSGGGASNFLVALNFAVALLAQNENLKSALLVAADIALPRNRVLNPARPVTVLGDSAGAMVLQRDAGHPVLGTELHSHGAHHDICFIPGGALAHPGRPDLYRLQLDENRYDAAAKFADLARVARALLQRLGISAGQITFYITPNLSAADQAGCAAALEIEPGMSCTTCLSSHGHLQGTDFVLNWLCAVGGGRRREGDLILLGSHGMGFMTSASVVRF